MAPAAATVGDGARADVAAAVETLTAHYQELYRGVYEWLRAPPSLAYRARARAFLVELMACYHPFNMVQGHRIQWTREWLEALARDSAGDDEHDSDADIVVGEG